MITQTPANYANSVAAFNPQGRSAVGLEVIQDQPTTFTPVVESAVLARRENQRDPNERVNNDGEQARLLDGAAGQASGELSEDDIARQKLADAKAQTEAKQQEQDQVVIAELAARDREVRAHEAAHAAVGGQYAGSPSYSFQRGPDGVSYAVGGEVSISVGAVANDPEATIAKAQQIQAAANAPADPSAQDRQVAAQAAQLQQQARVELSQLQAAERVEKTEQAEPESIQSAESVESGSVDNSAELEAEEKQKEAQQAARDADQAARDAEFARRNIDLGQRLIDIGVKEPNFEPAGTLFNLSA